MKVQSRALGYQLRVPSHLAGRTQVIELPSFTLVNSYVPMAGWQDEGPKHGLPSRRQLRLRYHRNAVRLIEQLQVTCVLRK